MTVHTGADAEHRHHQFSFIRSIGLERLETLIEALLLTILRLLLHTG